MKDIEFKVTGSDGSSYTEKTNSSGVAEFSGLKVYNSSTGKAITYTVSEINVASRYETPKAQNVTLANGNVDLTVNLTFINDLVKGNLKINKQSEDGENGDREFTIAGGGKTYTIKTGSDGIAILSDIPVYDSNNEKIVYTISEKNVPIKYVVPADQTATLTADATTTKTFQNVLKKFTAEVVKKDAETGSAQGDATLAGAVYGLYLDGDLVDTYTTDENGSFTTAEYICGPDWTIREIEPSPGYLLDETVNEVGAHAGNYTIEHNIIPVGVGEDVIKGDIAIIKHTDDGSTQIETPEEGAEFQIYLKSAGSYDAADPDERDILTCDADGFAQSKKLPYGEYVVEQTKGWDGTEYMPAFTVTINEHGKTYKYIINNAEFEAYLKIVKVDAETGEELPGATLELYAPDGTLLESWETSDIPHVITGLPVGEGYVLKETAAPEGYELAEDIVFAVENTAEIQFVGMVDEPSPEEPETPEEPTEPEEPTPTVPQTGGSRMALWVGALLILALGSLGIVLILLKKQNKL